MEIKHFARIRKDFENKFDLIENQVYPDSWEEYLEQEKQNWWRQQEEDNAD